MLNWEKVDEDYVAIDGNFVFRLHHSKMGVYAIGSGLTLQVRRRDESEYKSLGYSFCTLDDNHNLYTGCLDSMIWKTIAKNGTGLLGRAEKILAGNYYLN